MPARGERRQSYIAVIGPGENASSAEIRDARQAGTLIAERGWITLSGGRDAGVMAAAAEGANSRDGVSIGLLPGDDRSDAAPALTAALPTGLGEGRNAVLVTAADGVIACGINAGTLSEIALAIRAKRPIALVRPSASLLALLAELGAQASIHAADTPEDAVRWIAQQLD